MKKLHSLAVLLIAFLALAGCSAESSYVKGPSHTPGGGDEPPPSAAAIVILSASKTVILPDNTDESEITATLLTANNVLLPDTEVYFSTNGGAVNSVAETTDSAGVAKIKFTSGALLNGGEATITANSGDATASVTIKAVAYDIPATLGIVVAPGSVKTDDAELSLITVTVLNASGGVIPNQTVNFATTGGTLSATSATTGSDGKASTTFSSGQNKSNSTVMIDITAGSLAESVSIVVVGSTLTLSGTSPMTLASGQKETLTVTAKDAAGDAIPAQAITFASAGVGSVNLSADTAITGIDGKASVEVTGAAIGTANLTVQGVGATAIKVYDIAGTTGGEYFHISTPASEVASGRLNEPFTVNVSAPAATQVRFATTLGIWGNGSNVQTVAVAAGTASAQLTSDLAGTATISATDPANPGVTDSVTISFSAAAETASQITVRANPSVMAITLSPDSTQEAQLEAIVHNAANQVVGGAPVSFRILNPTGGGEFISPPVAYTNALGRAEATFTSGVLSSPQGVEVVAALVDFPTIEADTEITIGGEAGAITLGRSTEMTSLDGNTYSLPMSAMVSDGKGGPAVDVPVSLTVWPEKYFACNEIHYANEDKNENLILDAGEDVNDNKQLDPPSAVAGNIIPGPPIKTNSNGIANFNLVYLKANHNTYVKIRATTGVSGTEAISTMYFYLPILVADHDKIPKPTLLPNIPDFVCP